MVNFEEADITSKERKERVRMDVPICGSSAKVKRAMLSSGEVETAGELRCTRDIIKVADAYHLKKLIKCLEHENLEVRSLAFSGLLDLGKKERAAIKSLTRSVSGRSKFTEYNASIGGATSRTP